MFESAKLQGGNGDAFYNLQTYEYLVREHRNKNISPTFCAVPWNEL